MPRSLVLIIRITSLHQTLLALILLSAGSGVANLPEILKGQVYWHQCQGRQAAMPLDIADMWVLC
jgi:hypothetical protein